MHVVRVVRTAHRLRGELVSAGQGLALRPLFLLAALQRVRGVAHAAPNFRAGGAVITTMPWGKHAGKPLTSVPRGYLSWALRECQLSPDLRTAIKAAMNGDVVVPQREPGDDTRDLLGDAPAPSSRSSRSKRGKGGGTRERIVAHINCHRCGGSSVDGRPMLHVDCIDKDDVPF